MAADVHPRGIDLIALRDACHGLNPDSLLSGPHGHSLRDWDGDVVDVH